MPFPFLAVGAGLALANAAGRFFSGNKQTRESKKIKPNWQQYTASPFAKQQLDLSKQLYGGRMFGAPQLERNIFTNQANTMGQFSRNATDSSQLLSLGAAAQGQTNQSLTDLQTMESQNKYSMLDNLNRAYGTMIGEGDKEYDSMFQKYQMDAQRKDALRNAGAQNKYGAISDLSSMAFTMAGANTGGLSNSNVFSQPRFNQLQSTLPYPGVGNMGGIKPKFKIPGIN